MSGTRPKTETQRTVNREAFFFLTSNTFIQNFTLFCFVDRCSTLVWEANEGKLIAELTDGEISGNRSVLDLAGRKLNYEWGNA